MTIQRSKPLTKTPANKPHMCKLFLATGPMKQQTQRALLIEINDAFACTQKDGFGFLSRGKSADQIAYGRYLSPSHFPGFGAKASIPDWLTPPMDECGSLPQTSYCLLAHGRTSTSKVCLENVHPFRNQQLFLAHNGILRWIGQGVGPIAPNGCDSEEFFQWITRNNFNWKAARENWGGSGAVIVSDIEAGITVVAQDDANLTMAKRKSGGWIVSTFASDIETIARKSGLGLLHKPLKVPRKLIFFGPTGEIIGDTDWAGFGSPGYVSQYDRDRVYNADTGRTAAQAFFAQGQSSHAEGTNGNCNPKGFQPDPKRLPVRVNKVSANGCHGPATTEQVLGTTATDAEIQAELEAEQTKALAVLEQESQAPGWPHGTYMD